MTHFATILNSTLYLLLSLALSMLAISLAVFILKALWDYQFPTHQVNQSVTRLELAFLAVASVGGLIYTNLVYSWATAFYEANTKPSFLVQVVSTTSGLLGSSSQLLYNGVISAKQTIVGRSMLGQLWENVETTLQLGFSILKAPMNIIQSVFGLVIFIVNVVLNLGLFAIVPAVLMYSIYNHPTTVSAGLSSVYNSLHNNFNDRNNPPPPVFPLMWFHQ